MLRKPGSKRRTRRADQAGASFLTLDIGTEWAKAVITNQAQRQVLSAGYARQHLGDMDGGAIANIAGVTETVSRALREAVSLADAEPQLCLAGIAGELVQGVVSSITSERKRPDVPLTLREISRLAWHTVAQAHMAAKEKTALQSGIRNPHVELVDTALIEIRIDGYRVSNPVGFRGKHLAISVFHTFSPLVHVRAIESVVRSTGCQLLGIVAEPFAVATCALPAEAYELGAVVVDIGGGSTDVAVLEKGGVVGTKMVAMGGRAFTRSLADAFSLSLDIAEELKIDYATGSLAAEQAEQVRSVIDADMKVFVEALRLAFSDLKGAGTLPTHVYFCGGGSGLPGILDLLDHPQWLKQGFFTRTPTVVRLSPGDVKSIQDPQGFLQGFRDVTPKALATQGARVLADRFQEGTPSFTGIRKGG
ncbi:MAG TPA: pilus assembly protein PilM [Firmicutes bacterium]|jgi:cell division protein FtsA|nr:pilus assembly protein PilM [Bacillota bacterium]